MKEDKNRIHPLTSGTVLQHGDRFGYIGYEAELQETRGRKKNPYWRRFTQNRTSKKAEKKPWDHTLNQKGTRLTEQDILKERMD